MIMELYYGGRWEFFSANVLVDVGLVSLSKSCSQGKRTQNFTPHQHCKDLTMIFDIFYFLISYLMNYYYYYLMRGQKSVMSFTL